MAGRRGVPRSWRGRFIKLSPENIGALGVWKLTNPRLTQHEMVNRALDKARKDYEFNLKEIAK